MGNNLFLLGGYDLEMLTIKDILVDLGYTDITVSKDFSQDLCFADKKLQWGASLDEYTEFFSYAGNIYGIELTESVDFVKPENYIRIDHHNDYADKPSSLEQICNVLSVPLTRQLQLISANDSAYIPGMKTMGATQEEIEAIRFADRQAQGVCELDEENAVLSLQKNKSVENNIIVIHSLTPKFSTITDRLFPFEKLMILYQDHLVFYGEGVRKLIEHFSGMLQQNKAYTGGGGKGYFGIPEGVFSEKELDNFKNEMLKVLRDDR